MPTPKVEPQKPIDLSAGLVPKQPDAAPEPQPDTIDLSAGLVPNPPAQPTEQPGIFSRIANSAGQFLGDLKDQNDKQQEGIWSQPTLLGKLGAAGKAIVSNNVDLGTGILKGAGNTANSLAHYSLSGYNPVNPANAIPGFRAVSDKMADTAVPLNPDVLKPTNPLQKAGYGTEQVAEFAAPEGEILKGTEALKAASKGIPFLGRYIPKLGEYGLRGLTTGGIEALHGGSPQDIKTATVAGGLMPAVGDVAAGAIKPIAQRLAPAWMNQILKPGLKDFTFGKNPGKQVVDEGITAVNPTDLLDNIAQRREEVGKIIGDKLTAPNVASKFADVTQSIVAPLQKAKEKALQMGQRPLYQSLDDLETGLTRGLVKGENGQLVAGEPKNLVLPPAAIQKLKRDLGESTKWYGIPYESEINQAKAQVYRNLNNDIERLAPRTKALNARWANLLSAENSLDKTIKVSMRHQMVSGPDLVTGALGTLASGGNPMAGVALATARKALGSTAAKTYGAAAISGLPGLIMNAIKPVAGGAIAEGQK